MSFRHWSVIVAIGLIALTFVGPANSVPVHDQPTNQQPTTQPSSGQSSQQTSPDAAGVSQTPRPTVPPTDEHDSSHGQYADSEPSNDLILGDGLAQWIMAVTGMLALLLSAWAVWLIYWTMKATQQTLGEAEKTTGAAIESLNITKDTAYRTLRAYVGISNVEGTVRRVGDQFEIWIKVTVTNTGLTPAVFETASITLAETKPRRGLKFVQTDFATSLVPTWDAAKDATAHMQGKWAVQGAEIFGTDDLNAGPKQLQIEARIFVLYRDYMGKHHQTRESPDGTTAETQYFGTAAVDPQMFGDIEIYFTTGPQ